MNLDTLRVLDVSTILISRAGEGSAIMELEKGASMGAKSSEDYIVSLKSMLWAVGLMCCTVSGADIFINTGSSHLFNVQCWWQSPSLAHYSNKTQKMVSTWHRSLNALAELNRKQWQVGGRVVSPRCRLLSCFDHLWPNQGSIYSALLLVAGGRCKARHRRRELL